jgi:hypothetical protein
LLSYAAAQPSTFQGIAATPSTSSYPVYAQKENILTQGSAPLHMEGIAKLGIAKQYVAPPSLLSR